MRTNHSFPKYHISDVNLYLLLDAIMAWLVFISDVIMCAMASQFPIVCSTVCSATDQRKLQSSASLAFVRGTHRWPMDSPHKGPVTWKVFPFDYVIMLGVGKFKWHTKSHVVPLIWRFKYMMTSSNGIIFRVTGPLCGEFTGPGEFPTQRPVTRSFHVFFDLRLNKRLSKQPWGWWFETPSRSLWRHCDDMRNDIQIADTWISAHCGY